MTNRNPKLNFSLLNYRVSSPFEYIKGFPDLNLKTRSVVGVLNEGEKTEKQIIYARSVPKNFTVGEGAKPQKAVPDALPGKVESLYKRAKLIGIDRLNNGAQVALTTAYLHPEEQDAYLPLKSFEVDGYTVQMYRIFLYRYDQLKNDHFIEVVIHKKQDAPGERLKTVHFYIPTKSKNISKIHDGRAYEDALYDWLMWAQDPKNAHAGNLRDYLYTTLFNARTDADFPNKTAKKYERFTRLRKLMVRAEGRLGNNALSVFLAFCYWYWTEEGRNELENDMIGYYGKKFYSLYRGFMEESKSPETIPQDYTYQGDKPTPTVE